MLSGRGCKRREQTQEGKMIDVTKLGKSGITTLHQAVLAENIDALTALLMLGKNPNELDTHGMAPLHYAVMKNSLAMTKRLLDKQYEADVNIKSKACKHPFCAEAVQCILMAMVPKLDGKEFPTEDAILSEYFRKLSNDREEDPRDPTPRDPSP